MHGYSDVYDLEVLLFSRFPENRQASTVCNVENYPWSPFSLGVPG